jgi:hypothetical protein
MASRLDPTEVYCQIVPESTLLATTNYRVRILLPYGPATMPSDVRTTWGRVSERLWHAVWTARNEGATDLPPQLEDCLAIELTVPARIVDDPAIDLVMVIERDLQATIIAALRSRDADRRN